MSKRDLEKTVEWEVAAAPIEFGRIQLPKPFVDGITKMVISRDDEMMLTLVAEGTMANAGEAAVARRIGRDRAAGAFLEPVEVTFEAHGATCSLRAYVDDEPDEVWHTADGPPRFKQSASHIRLSKKWNQKFEFDPTTQMPRWSPLGDPAWRSDWYINGPHRPFLRFTDRRRTGAYVRERGDVKLTIAEPPSSGSIRDHFLIETPTVRFTLGQVPEDLAPQWCHATVLEFPSPVPDQETRLAIAEFVSFVLGRRLMALGSTVFDAEGWPIECEARDPWGHQIRADCQRGDLEPIPMRLLHDDVETVLSGLLPLYLEARQQFALRDALLTYWLANEGYTGVDLALYGSAVEALKHAWFKSSKTKSKGVYLSQDDFNRLAGDALPALERSLEAGGAPKAVIGKMRRSFQMSGNEQLTAFFKELALPVGPVELAAIRARNAPVHGGLSAGADQKQLVRDGRAYRCLFERVFLKMIGYSGQYVDRTAPGHPARHIDEPCAGDA